jgi:serine/threonine-protein kinase
LSENKPAKDSLVGKFIDSNRYKIEARIASGGMATVYRATDTRLDREVAMKIIHPHLIEGEKGAKFIAEFRKESKNAAKLRGPGVVTIYDTGTDGQLSFLVMELVEGTNLRARLKQVGTFSVGDALKITELILRPLDAAFRQRLIHRDVKPENILINKKGELKLTDFGLSKVATDTVTTMTDSVYGTISYLAPEVIDPKQLPDGTYQQPDYRVDVYAVGIMLYELIAGFQPYNGDETFQIALKHVSDDVPNLSEQFPKVPKSVSDYICRLCERDREKRPDNAHEALKELIKIATNLSANELAIKLPRPPKKEKKAETKNSISQINKTTTSKKFTTKNTGQFKPGSISLPSSPFKPEKDNSEILSEEEDNISTEFLTVNEQLAGEEFSRKLQREEFIAKLNQSDELNQREEFNQNNEIEVGENQETSDLENFSKKTKNKKKIIKLFAVLISILFIAGIVFWYIFYGPGGQIKIPSGLIGAQAQQAEQILNNDHIKYSISEEYSDTIKTGTVISTEPSTGNTISQRLGQVTIIVSKGINFVNMPKNLVGQNLETVQAALKQAGFDGEYKINEVYSNSVEKGNITKISPKEGTLKIKHNAKVKINVSKGKKPIEVPNLTGMDYSTAEEKLDNLGLKFTEIKQFSNEIDKNDVISQDQQAGKILYSGDLVTLTISKGTENVSVPNVVGMTLESAKSALDNLDLKWSISGDQILKLVQKQNITAGESVKRGTVVGLTIA